MASLVKSLKSKLSTSKDKKQPQIEEPDKEELKDLREKYEKAEQDHVFHYYEELDIEGRAALFEQLSRIDPERVNEIAKHVLASSDSEEGQDDTPSLEPLPEHISASLLECSEEDLKTWNTFGLQLIAENKVAVVLMAGGQGTRLGSSAPKGCYDIDLPSHKSLFQLQAERIVKLQELAAIEQSKPAPASIPWYIMTSGPTTQPTQEFFEQHNYFGLDRDNVMFFEQGILPCIDNEGKILLEDQAKVSVAPDGNGGIYQAMFLNSILSDMRKRGVEHVHAYCVDNCLVKVADPVFMGYAAGKNVDIATKVVRKRDAKESVGLIMQRNGKPAVVEYTEIKPETAEAKDSKDLKRLKFRAANIVNHYYSLSFLDSTPTWSHKLPHHVAKKKIPYIDLDKDQLVKPEKANGIKLEQFVFDCFPFVEMDKFACLEVKRDEEFSPLKNGPGTGHDDPETSKRDILDQGRRWIEAAGAVVVSEGEEPVVEISPLISYGGEGLNFLRERTLKSPAVIEREPAEGNSK